MEFKAIEKRESTFKSVVVPTRVEPLGQRLHGVNAQALLSQRVYSSQKCQSGWSPIQAPLLVSQMRPQPKAVQSFLQASGKDCVGHSWADETGTGAFQMGARLQLPSSSVSMAVVYPGQV